ncbi:MAG: Acetyltransferase family [Archaeoglobus sp.]|nr:Acetyltransferase family [Archaeoglobus sp.]
MHRRKGIGRLLLRQAEQFAKENGKKVIKLDVINTNYPAIDLYKKHGFLTEKEVKSKILIWFFGIDGYLRMVKFVR